MSDSVEAAVAALRDCGISRPEQYAVLAAPDRVLETCRWWQKQNGVGTGLLITELRAGGRKPRPSVVNREREFGDAIVAFLREHFPQYNEDTGNRSHPAAIAAVARRHGEYGFSARKHGPEIRAAVNAFNKRYL